MAQTATVSPVLQINRSSFSQSQSLSFLFNRSRKVRSVNLGNSTLKASAVWTAEKNFRIWSIRDDLQLPPSYSYAQGGQRPPAMLREHFQSVISQLFQHRIILCSGAVDDDKANVIVAQLLYLDVVDPNKDIIMYVNSPGGSVTAGLAIFDTMRQVRPDISTVCVGFAASMGAFLLSAGTKGKTTRSTLHYTTGNLRLISSYIDKNITGKRYSYPNSRIMIHKPFGKAQGSQTDIGILANEVLLHKANLIRYLSYHTGQSLEKINKDTDRDFFMSAIEAKQYGLIDDVILNPLKAFPPLAATPAVESESQSSVFPQ